MAVETIERLRYYQWQYLGAQDLEDQQAYHRDMRRRHNLGHHTWGIVVGLELETGTDPGDIYVRPGMAIDGFGREIVVFRLRKLNPDDLGPCKEGKYGDVWIAYEEKLTRPPSKGYELCGEENERRRVQEVYRIVVCARTPGDDKTLDHDIIVVAGQKMDSPALPQEGDPSEGPTELTIPPDESVPYQEFPDDEAEPYWPIYLGTVSWDSAQEEFIVDGTEREYVSSVAAQVLAPAGTLRIRDRLTDPLHSDDVGVAVELEGSLQVHRLLTAKEDVQIHGGKLDFRDDVGKAGQDDGYPLTIARSGNDLQVQLGKSGDSADLSRLVVGPRVDNVFHEKLVVQNNGDVTVDGNLVVKEPGKVGIGTTVPDTSLHIATGSDATLEKGTGYLLIGSVGGLNLVMDNNQIQARKGGEASGLYLQLEGGDLAVNESQKRFVVKDSGRVGIGTALPTEALHIAGDDPDLALDINSDSPNSWAELRFKVDNDTKSRIYWSKQDYKLHLENRGTRALTIDGGNVGIGTTSPARKLHVVGDRILLQNETGDKALNMKADGSAVALVTETNNLYIRSGSNQVLINPFDSDGNVGIGTTSPAYKLHVVGDRILLQNENRDKALHIRVDGGAVDLGTGTNHLYICSEDNHHVLINPKETDGNVGIGTPSPKEKLDVNGRILRKGQAFSVADVASHNDIVTVPWGTRNDWNIFVSPKYMGDEESGSEADNALLKIECYAEPVTANDTQWRIIARYKFHYWPHDNIEHPNGVWSDSGQSNMDPPEVNYILVPK